MQKYHKNFIHAVKAYAEDRLKNRRDIEMDRIFVTHTRCEEGIVEEIKDLVRRYCPDMKEILETTAGATITTHCGPGTLGVLFVRKQNLPEAAE